MPFWTPAPEKDRFFFFFPDCRSNYFSCLSPSFPLLWLLLVKQWLRFCCAVLLRAPSVAERRRHNNTRPYGQGISSGLYLLIKSCHCHQPLCLYTRPCSSVTHAYADAGTDTARYGCMLIYEGRMRLDEQLSHWGRWRHERISSKSKAFFFFVKEF